MSVSYFITIYTAGFIRF